MKLLDIPFDEPSGAAIAYDYSPNRTDAVLVNGVFGAGYSGNCAVFSGVGYAEAEADDSFLEGDFAVELKFKTEPSPQTPTYVKLHVQFDVPGEDPRELEATLPVVPTDWLRLVIVRQGNSMQAYANDILFWSSAIDAGWGSPTGFCLFADNGTTEAGYCSIEDVAIHIPPFTAYEVVNQPLTVAYTINGVNFASHGVRVSGSSGILDNLKMKEPAGFDWPDYHGRVLDLSAPRYESREITLTCWIDAPDSSAFQRRVFAFLDEFRKPGTQRLMISAGQKPLVYQVYLQESIGLDKRWSAREMVGDFTLKLIEPSPVKRVLRHVRTSEDNKTVTVSFTSPKLMSVHWGDGAVTNNVYGEVSLTHDYATDGEYYIVVDGTVEDLTEFTTSAVIVWNRLF